MGMFRQNSSLTSEKGGRPPSVHHLCTPGVTSRYVKMALRNTGKIQISWEGFHTLRKMKMYNCKYAILSLFSSKRRSQLKLLKSKTTKQTLIAQPKKSNAFAFEIQYVFDQSADFLPKAKTELRVETPYALYCGMTS